MQINTYIYTTSYVHLLSVIDEEKLIPILLFISPYLGWMHLLIQPNIYIYNHKYEVFEHAIVLCIFCLWAMLI